MTNLKTTKRALLSSVVALLVCFTMFLGTTFAWFTDSVTSAGNKIVAGTLDVQLLMDADVDGTYDDISDSTSPIFGEGSIAQNNNAETLWEPGKTQVAYLAIKNNGNLDLKYTVGLNVQNVSKDLYEVMEYAIVPDADANNKVTAWNGGNSVVVGTQSVSGDVELKVGETHYFALAIHMDELAGNEYKGGEVNFDLTVLATQLASENDSFGNQYDADAKYPVVSTVTVPENNTEDVVLSTETVKVVVPSATAQAGDDYKIEVSNETTETDATTGETTVAFDLTMYKNNEKVSGTTVYAITKNVGAGLFISEVTHNGTVLTNATTGADQTYTYDIATGELTIYTASFSPFAVTYKEYVSATTVEDLMASITKGEPVTLAEDITLEFSATDYSNNNFTVAAGTKAIINLGGNNLTVKTTDGNFAFLMVEGDLTITGEGNVAVGQINAYNGSKLTIGEGVTISASGFSAINNSGTTVINGATINHDNTNANGNAINNQAGGTLIINDATVTSNSTKNVHTIGNNSGGTIIINGGTFTQKGSWGHVIYQGYEGEIIINGGTFIQNGNDSLASAEYGGKLTIKGGTFSANPSYVANGYKVVDNGDGTWTVTADN